MGINDKDYADALVYEKQKQAQQQQMERQKEEAKMGLLQNALGAFGGAGQQQALNSNGLSSSAYAQQQATLASGTVNANHITTSATITGSWENRSPLGVKTINEQDLKHDAMKAPLSALVDMWTMRWSGEWVSETEFQEDDFWRLALIRLVGANKLEKHHLANQYAAVYRIIE